MSGRLILLCGIAGAGKTTVAKQLEAGGAMRMCPDEWLVALGFDVYDRDARLAVEALQWEVTSALLASGTTVVDESGVWQRAQRDARRAWARQHGVDVELRFLDAPVDVLTARVAERNRSLPEGAPRIEPALVAFWDQRIERPDADELALFDPPGPWPSRRVPTSDVRLILTCGLPGAGKTTLARQLAADRPAVRLTKDEWLWTLGSTPWDAPRQARVERHLRRLADEILRHDVSVVVDFGLWARVERDELRTAARQLGAGVELHHLDAPVDELWQRVDARNARPPWDIHPIRRSDLDGWAQTFQAPDATELALFDPPPSPVSSR